MALALQDVSLSTAASQAPASSGGTSAAGSPSFRLLMQTASAAPQDGTTTQGQVPPDGKTAGRLSDGDNPPDPKAVSAASAVSAFAALFAAQQNPDAALPAADQAPQTGETDAAQGETPAQTQAAPVQPISSVKTAESTALLQAEPVHQNSMSLSVSGQKTVALSAAAQQLPAVSLQTPGSGASAQTAGQAVPAVSTAQNGEQPVFKALTTPTEASPQASSVSQASFSIQQTKTGPASPASSASLATQADSRLPQGSVAAVSGTQSAPSDKIVVLSAGGATGSDDSASAQTQTGSGRNSAGRTALVGNGDDRGDPVSTADPASSMAALYADGKVVVKVSEKAAQTQASLLKQVVDAAAEGFKSGVKRLTVDLYPESLGKVSVQLVSKDGLLTVQLAADNTKTQALLASSSGEIRTMLQNTTGQPVQVVKPEQTAAQQWYPQGGDTGGQDRRQQEGGSRRKDEEMYTAGNVGAISTDDFLTLMQKTADA